ncbi:hypothetical protein KAW43_02110 [Candidatus Parcubacteria bacterium]|nr:hypothetical protein [Candidatus Parcubacteria bacterium]
MENKKIIEEEFKIPIEELFPKFKEHLEIKDNSRILFSGKFGIGKTYFLKEFFRANQEEYEVFHFSPINYQINSNEDISEFLKYDILVELNRKNKDIFQENDYNNLIDLQRLFFVWGKNNFTEIFKNGLSYIPKLGRPLKETAKLVENFWTFKQKIEAGEKGIIENFLKKIKEENIAETDYLSELLREKIQKQKNEKQSILILDDLERIDPEHIFRILNVFSAHFDLQNKELPNKFGFDKIILVADIQNLKSIFHHKYGEQTDFSGYFNKFFTVEIFQFKNEEIIEEAMNEIISRFQTENENLSKELNNSAFFLTIFLKDILLKSLELDGKEKLDLRQLLKGVKYQIPILKNSNYRKDSFGGRYTVISQIINIGIKFFISIFGGMKIDFVSVLKKIKNDIKNKENTTRGYDVFSYYLLKTISPFEETESNLKHGWNGYSIEIENRKIKSIAKKIGAANRVEANISDLFFDLLIEYVSEKIYEKPIEIY